MTPADLIREDAATLVDGDPLFAGLDPSGLPIEIWGPGFGPLVHLILGQQVSIEAADAMYRNLETALGTVTPEGLLSLDEKSLRRCGFTRMKAEYGRGLATACLDGLDLDALSRSPDGELIEVLTALRGIGRWTAECYLLFCLGRRDVFPAGDMALRVGYQELAGLATEPNERATRDTAEAWAPRRTAAAYLVWHSYLERRGRVGSVPFE